MCEGRKVLERVEVGQLRKAIARQDQRCEGWDGLVEGRLDTSDAVSGKEEGL